MKLSSSLFKILVIRVSCFLFTFRLQWKEHDTGCACLDTFYTGQLFLSGNQIRCCLKSQLFSVCRLNSEQQIHLFWRKYDAFVTVFFPIFNDVTNTQDHSEVFVVGFFSCIFPWFSCWLWWQIHLVLFFLNMSWYVSYFKGFLGETIFPLLQVLLILHLLFLPVCEEIKKI